MIRQPHVITSDLAKKIYNIISNQEGEGFEDTSDKRTNERRVEWVERILVRKRQRKGRNYKRPERR